jgi:hypothetical protein
MRHQMVRFVGVLVLMLAVLMPTVTQAGGWSVIALDAVPTNIQAGVPFEVGFTVLQHGKTPVAGLQPEITFVNTAGERVQVIAEAQGRIGHYLANITLPAAGEWNWEVNAFGPPQQMQPIQISAVLGRLDAPMTTPNLQFSLLALVALVVIGLSGFGIRRWQQQRSAL